MIDINAYYVFNANTRDCRRCYKSVFEKTITDADVFDFRYDSPEAEAYVEIASEFGFNVDSEASELVLETILGNVPDNIDRKLMTRVLDYIENENLVCYRTGMCAQEMLTFRDEDAFFYEDSGELFCILKSEEDAAADKDKAHRITTRLAKICDDVVAYPEAIMLEKKDNYI